MSQTQNFATPYVAPPPTMFKDSFDGMPFWQSTLESKLQQLLAQVTTMTTLSLINEGVTSPDTFPVMFLAAAMSMCSEGDMPDCGNKVALAAEYSALAQAAYANVPASQWNAATFTDGGTTTVAPAPPPPPAGSLFGVPVGDGRLNLGALAISEINGGALFNGAIAVNPADGKTYSLTFAQGLAGMGLSGFWTPQA